jgi:DNA-binding beta-propeller fold protein YncE
MRWIVIYVLVVMTVGCSAAPVELHYFPDEVAAERDLFWPRPPEPARLAYAGELIGEVNFRKVDGTEDSTGLKILRWVAGIGRGKKPVTELIRPQSGMVDSSGRVLVTDAGRQAVLVFSESPAGLYVWDEAEPGKSFLSPVGIVEDGAGGYFVADADLGYLVRLSSEGVPEGQLGKGLLKRPTGLARDADTGEVYVADTGAHDIKVFAGQGTLLRTIGTRGVGDGEFNGPTHLSFANGQLYVSDTLNARVHVLLPTGEPVGIVGQRGLFVGNLVRPKGVVTDRDGHIYVVESYYDHVLVFGESGELLLPIGGTGGDAGRFFLPAGAWSANGDRLYIADMFNGRVVVLNYLGEAQ